MDTNIHAEQRQGAMILRPAFNRLDAAAATGFRQRATELIGDNPLVIVDLAEVHSVDSSGLGALIALLKALPPGGRLRLAHACERVRKILQLTRLGSVLPAHDSIDGALGAASAP